ncbi:high mobility group box domain-containing protein, partial [Phlyctochytrium arcticum]
RPANSFIIYRREKQDEVMRANEGITNNEASRLIGQMWANEPTDVKEIYKKKAEDAKRLHNITFPDYKYAPRK